MQVASKIRRKGQLQPDGAVGPPTLQARASQRLSMDTGDWTGRCNNSSILALSPYPFNSPAVHFCPGSPLY